MGALVIGLLATAGHAQQEELDQLNQQVFNLYRSGRYADGVSVAFDAMRLTERLYGPQHASVAEGANNLAEMYRMLGRFEEALQLYERALKITQITEGPDNILTAAILNNLGEMYRLQGAYEKAEPLYKEPLTRGRSCWGLITRTRRSRSTTWRCSRRRNGNTTRRSRSTSARWRSTSKWAGKKPRRLRPR